MQPIPEEDTRMQTCFTSNISEEAFKQFLKEQYDYPPTDGTPLNEAFDRDCTYFGSIGDTLFSFDVKSGSQVLNLREIEVTTITLENLGDPNSGVREIFHDWLSDETSTRYAREWLINFVQKTDVASMTTSDFTVLIPLLICTDEGIITDVGFHGTNGLRPTDLALYRFILHSVKKGIYPWDHIS